MNEQIVVNFPRTQWSKRVRPELLTLIAQGIETHWRELRKLWPQMETLTPAQLLPWEKLYLTDPATYRRQHTGFKPTRPRFKDKIWTFANGSTLTLQPSKQQILWHNTNPFYSADVWWFLSKLEENLACDPKIKAGHICETPTGSTTQDLNPPERHKLIMTQLARK